MSQTKAKKPMNVKCQSAVLPLVGFVVGHLLTLLGFVVGKRVGIRVVVGRMVGTIVGTAAIEGAMEGTMVGADDGTNVGFCAIIDTDIVKIIVAIWKSPCGMVVIITLS